MILNQTNVLLFILIHHNSCYLKRPLTEPLIKIYIISCITSTISASVLFSIKLMTCSKIRSA